MKCCIIAIFVICAVPISHALKCWVSDASWSDGDGTTKRLENFTDPKTWRGRDNLGVCEIHRDGRRGYKGTAFRGPKVFVCGPDSCFCGTDGCNENMPNNTQQYVPPDVNCTQSGYNFKCGMRNRVMTF